MFFRTISLFILISASLLNAQSHDAKTELHALLDYYIEAWNSGDVEASMEIYRKSETLTFSSKGVTIRGWDALYERYRGMKQPDMGTITMSDVEVHLLSSEKAYVFGRYRVERPEKTTEGAFTMICENTHDSWKVIHEHSSSHEVQ